MPYATVLNAGNEMVSTKAKVLIVDDDELIRTTEKLILESGNFEVVTAGSVNDAQTHRHSGLRCTAD
jgi:DNA-binding NtrC family response regulator